MPFHPSNSTAFVPTEPRAGASTHFAPRELEIIYAQREPASPSWWVPAPAPGPATVIEITSRDAVFRPVQEETFSPLHLRRAGMQDEPLAPPAMAQSGMRDIAGTPLNSWSGGSPSNRFSASGDLLSSPSGNQPVLNHVTPEFDSTHQIMRIPSPPESMVPPRMSGQAGSSILGNLPELPRISDAEEFQADIAMPRHTPSFSWTLDITGLGNPQLTTTTTTTTTTTPQSAPPTLERLPAVPPGAQVAREQDEHEYSQALAEEHTMLALLEAGLGKLDSAVQRLEIAQSYVFDVYAAWQRNRQAPATEAAGDDTSSDDEAVQAVGSPDPHAM